MRFGHARPSVPPAERLKALYDRLAPIYFLAHPFVRGVAARAAQLLARSTSLETLDICTGTGVVAEELARRGHRATGIDVSMPMLRQRNALRRQMRISGAQMDARALAFTDRAFDLCSVSMGLHEFSADDRGRILAEMMRVTRRYVLVADYSGPQSWPVRVVEHLERSHYRDFTDGSLPDQLRQAGLHIEEQDRWFSIGVYLCRIPHSNP
jgi:ubiquinone/menaquinone biosynthesis C-methylase UbiE